MAQDESAVNNDSIEVSDLFFTFTDSLLVDSLAINMDSIVVDSVGIDKELAKATKEAFRPNPNKALLYSAIVPGLGQIYNRKYWKLPLVYGSFIGCAYAISWNGTQYNGYRNAYVDFLDSNESADSWKVYARILRYPDELSEMSDAQKTQFTTILKNQKDRFRRYRDLSIIVSVGVYAIWIIDAYVDAQLFDFDISPDLSMRIDPVVFERTSTTSRSVGLQWSFTF